MEEEDLHITDITMDTIKNNSSNVTQLTKGLNTDFSPQVQPEGSYRFALNAVNETELGDSMFLSNEESNVVSAALPDNYTPIGKCFIGNGNTVLFLVSNDEVSSEIGIFNEDGKYTSLVNTDVLNFKMSQQIDCTYRLRRGCERTLYFTDNFNPPRYYNIDKDYNFKSGEVYVASLFNLFKTYKTIPKFKSLEITEEGMLPSGSYNIAIQYIDQDLNPTEWITVSDTIIIYNDNTSKSFEKIRGSSNAVNSYQNFGPTNKAIKVEVENLDTDYPLYRLALVECNNGSGQITRISTSQELSIDNPKFTFNGNSTVSTITEEEILTFQNSVNKVAHIEQLENRLLLANVKNKSVDWWRLQKYASKIATDVKLESINLSILEENNPKNGLVHTQKIGYMPGEIYSLGIVYVFEDGATSPVFHIPGKGPTVNDTYTYTGTGNAESATIKGMRKSDNFCANSVYRELTTKCKNKDFWGVDCEGVSLVGKPLRHHRFPLRSEINEPLVTEGELDKLNIATLAITGTVSASDILIGSLTFSCEVAVDGITSVYKHVLTIPTTEGTVLNATYIIVSSHNVTIEAVGLSIFKGETIDEYTGGNIIGTLTDNANTSYTRFFSSKILGLQFSNIELPSNEDTNGNRVVGYYIVRNERTEATKTILDSGVLAPTLKTTATDKNARFIASGILVPAVNDYGETDPEDIRIKGNVVSLINPEFKFNKREYKNFSVLQEGTYEINSRLNTHLVTSDVQAGTSYNPEVHSGGADNDGFDLNTLSENVEFEYIQGTTKEEIVSHVDDKEVFYLSPLAYKNIETIDIAPTYGGTQNAYDLLTEALGTEKSYANPVYNIACDNGIGIISLNKYIPHYYGGSLRLPYIVLKSPLTDFYSTFKTLPYYLETSLQTESTCEVFNGDSYISPMKYTNSIFYDLYIKKRKTKKSWFKYLVAGVLAVAGTILIATGVGAALGTLALVGVTAILGAGAALFVAQGIQIDALAATYEKAYEDGLREGVEDNLTKAYFGTHLSPITAGDDQIRWFTQTLSDLWFESSVNMNWRKGTTIGLTDFLDSPAKILEYQEWTNVTSPETSELLKDSALNAYALDKLTVVDTEHKSGRLYKGYAGAEIYEINPDYTRRNKQKVYFALGIEYDCCSKCSEEFPHRVMYSEQSFQEELTDNYRIFLPNNYRDIDGETGVITNLFKIQNSIFVHTKEGLWNMPKNYQERVTNQIVSFLGTGSYFEIPPQKIVDDASGNSAGTSHKWGCIKTQHGFFFVCEKQNCFYMFNGTKLQPITDNGIKNEIYYKIPMAINSQVLKGSSYSNDDNPSNPIGTGYILAYDSKKERILFTKKDFKIDSLVTGTDFELVYYNGTIILFEDYQATIDAKTNPSLTAPEEYFGIIDGVMSFSGTDVTGTVIDSPIQYNKSWTLSYSLNTQSWVSWHSYLPIMYLSTSQNIFSIKEGNNNVWQHNAFGKYGEFYGDRKPFIIEVVSSGNPLANRIWDSVTVIAEAKKWIAEQNEFIDMNNVFFTDAIFYNSRQCSGKVSIKIKDKTITATYLSEQITDTEDVVVADRHERNWSLNNLRDYRTQDAVTYVKPIFKSDEASIAEDYFIDKVVNEEGLETIGGVPTLVKYIDSNKNWDEIENFRDKYLVIRLIFDTFEDVKLLMNYSIENETQSFR